MSIWEAIKEVNAPLPAEESKVLRAAILLSVMIATLALFHELPSNGALRVAAIVGIPAGHIGSHLTRRRTGLLLKLLLALGALLAMTAFLRQVKQIGLESPTDLQIPLAELFLWIQIIHSADVPARRDLMFSLVSSFTLIAVAGVLSTSTTHAAYLAPWGVACLVSMNLAYKSRLAGRVGVLAAAPNTALGKPSSSTWTLRARYIQGLRGAMRYSGRTLALGLPLIALTALAFALLPAAGGARSLVFPSSLPDRQNVPSLGGLSNPSLGKEDPGRGGEARSGNRSDSGAATFSYFGFSRTLDTAIRGRPDDSIVMRVRAAQPDFWRGQTFDSWDGRTWSMSDEATVPIVGDRPLSIPILPENVGWYSTDEFVQTFYLERGGPNLVYGAPLISEVVFPDRTLFQLSDGTLRAGVDLGAGTAYTVFSRRSPITADLLRETDNTRSSVPPDVRLGVLARYATEPVTTDRVKALALRITKDAPTTYDKVRALEAWMGSNTEYSLDIPPLPNDADAVDQFLFEDRQGFCEQIGSALVVMLRSLGIPARLVVGFTPGERNPFTGLYEVRGTNAHAWAEVWFPTVGWQGFDPTANVPLAGETRNLKAGSGMLDFITKRLPSAPSWLPIVTKLLGILVVLGALGDTARRVRLRQRKNRSRTWASVQFAALEKLAEKHSRPARPTETLKEFASALSWVGLERISLDKVARAIESEEFSGAPLSEDARADIEELIVALAAKS